MSIYHSPEWHAAEAKHAQRAKELADRGWGRPEPYDRHDVYTNFKINQWQMRQGIEPEETT